MSSVSSAFSILPRELQEEVVSYLSPEGIFSLEESHPRFIFFGDEDRRYTRELSRLIYDVKYIDFNYYLPSVSFNAAWAFESSEWYFGDSIRSLSLGSILLSFQCSFSFPVSYSLS